MSRAKHKVSKLIEPGNSAEQNRRIAQDGEFADMPEWETVFFWRWRSMFIEWRMTRPKLRAAAKKAEAAHDAQIGETMRAAMLRGDWQFLERLAKCVKDVAERYRWKADSITDFSDLLARRGARFIDPVKATVVQEYYFHHGIVVDKAKKSRKAFIAYIAKKMRRAVDERGTFAKAFDRACKALGIIWRGKVDNS